MRIIRFYDSTNLLKIEPESFEDLYLLAMVVGAGDVVSSKSSRRFKASEGDTGEQKDVFISISLEKIELDKSAGRLRLAGRIVGGKPEEFIRLSSYHTLNIGPSDMLEIQKKEWKSYIIKRLKQSVAESKRPKLGIIAVDDEKATVAYVRGYGIDIVGELYSHLSKRMKEKDYENQRAVYFNELIKTANEMKVDIVIIAGPGFTKDDIKKYIKANNTEVKKRFEYASASDSERSGVREVVNSESTSKILESEHVKKEFWYLNLFFRGLRISKSLVGPDAIVDALKKHSAGIILVNDSVLNDEKIKQVLDQADMRGVKIEIFNSDDEAGAQLKGFKNLVGLDRSLLAN